MIWIYLVPLLGFVAGFSLGKLISVKNITVTLQVENEPFTDAKINQLMQSIDKKISDNDIKR